MGKRAWRARRNAALFGDKVHAALVKVLDTVILPDWPVTTDEERQAAQLHAVCWKYQDQSTNEVVLALILGVSAEQLRHLRQVVLDLYQRYGDGYSGLEVPDEVQISGPSRIDT